MLTFTYNLPPAEANSRGERSSGVTPEPRQEAAPLAFPLSEWISGRGMLTFTYNLPPAEANSR
jgi:hypothetical protein